MNIAVIVPTLNAEPLWSTWILALQQQNCNIQQVIILDSGSTDNTLALAKENNFTIQPIDHFNHGATRQLGLELARDVDIAVYLTQDAILAEPDSLQSLIEAFEDPSIGAVYGRQLPASRR